MRLFKILVSVQSIYVFITAVWPLIDIKSFMAVTGPKDDIWLVKTVGALLIPVSLCLGSFLLFDTDRRPAMILGGLSAVAFICIDFYYALNDVISNVYMLDGILQILFLGAWIVVAAALAGKKNNTYQPPTTEM